MRLLRAAVGLAISLGMLWLLFRNLDLQALCGTLARMDFRPVPFAIMFYFFGVWVRSIRWGLLLPATRVSTGHLFSASVVGYAINNLLPARMGELARAYLLAHWCNVAYGTTAASLVIERVLDGLVLTLLLGLALCILPAPVYLWTLAVVAGVAFGGLAAAVGLGTWRSSTLIAIMGAASGRLPAGVRPGFERLVRAFIVGFTPLRSWDRVLLLVLLTVVSWGGQFGLFYVLMFAFALPVSVQAALMGGAVANFATLVPSSPASVGTFDGALFKVLVDVAGAQVDSAAAYTLVVHAVLFIPVIVLAAVILWRADLSFGALSRIGRRSAEPALQPALATNT